MTEQEIKAVLTAQAHIRARKRAVIHMALGEMEAALERSGVFMCLHTAAVGKSKRSAIEFGVRPWIKQG